MGRNSKVAKKTSGRKPRQAEAKGRIRRGRPKVCRFCSEHAVWVDYKDTNLLARFLNDRGRIRSRGSTGTCVQHQRQVAIAIKTAREMALLPYAVRTLSADPADRRGGARRSRDRDSSSSAPADLDQATGSDTDGVDAGETEGGAPADEERSHGDGSKVPAEAAAAGAEAPAAATIS